MSAPQQMVSCKYLTVLLHYITITSVAVIAGDVFHIVYFKTVVMITEWQCVCCDRRHRQENVAFKNSGAFTLKLPSCAHFFCEHEGHAL
jgi:hypothetical protein